MPAINLRLTDEQHQHLVEAAHSNRRSIQREIVGRLFGAGIVSEGISEQAQSLLPRETPVPPKSGDGGARPVDRRADPSPENSFKPDFGKKLKR